jgi:hypothetical protein
VDEFRQWFDCQRSVALRAVVLYMLLFASGSYMYVWCELFTPRWYNGRLAGRFGLLLANSARLLLERD